MVSAGGEAVTKLLGGEKRPSIGYAYDASARDGFFFGSSTCPTISLCSRLIVSCTVAGTEADATSCIGNCGSRIDLALLQTFQLQQSDTVFWVIRIFTFKLGWSLFVWGTKADRQLVPF
jgi:hypothetical protein